VIMQRDVALPNPVFGLRMRGSTDISIAFGPAIVNASAGMAPSVIAANLAAEYDAILARSGPIDDIRVSLWAGLGIRQMATPPSPPRGDAGQSPPCQDDGNTGGVKHVGVIVGVTIAVIALLTALLTAAFFFMRRFKLPLFGRCSKLPLFGRRSTFSRFGRDWIPAAGEDSTLVVTDIMDSTALWEMLDAGGMSRAVATHHLVVRKALAKFHGYEQVRVEWVWGGARQDSWA
jgi:hypothetical protein